MRAKHERATTTVTGDPDTTKLVLVRLAIRDAIQRKNERLRVQAMRWLWWVAPEIAERVGVAPLFTVAKLSRQSDILQMCARQ